jgi:hypothetical protein
MLKTFHKFGVWGKGENIQREEIRGATQIGFYNLSKYH